MKIKLSDKRYEEIKKIAVKMLIEFDVKCVPISGFEIANKMGVKVIPYSAIKPSKRYLLLKESDDGFSVEKNPGEWYIYYNDDNDKPYGRRNNTFMHELGHIVLDHTEDSELAEKDVKFFAKYTLAPPVLVKLSHLNDPESVSLCFAISFEAAGYALRYCWKRFHLCRERVKDYEIQLLKQFRPHFQTV